MTTEVRADEERWLTLRETEDRTGLSTETWRRYILQGRVRHEYGPGLKKVIENEAGDFIYIEPGVPHEVFNVSAAEPVVAVVARSDATEWENIIPYDRNQDR